jgi:hypothetical protein
MSSDESRKPEDQRHPKEGMAMGRMVSMAERADLSAASTLRSKQARGTLVYQRLTATADRTQAGLRAMLRARGVSFSTFWVANVVKVSGDLALLNDIAARSDVARVELDGVTPVPKPIAATPGGSGINAIGWGVNNIRAPSVWATFGTRGRASTSGRACPSTPTRTSAAPRWPRRTSPGRSR